MDSRLVMELHDEACLLPMLLARLLSALDGRSAIAPDRAPELLQALLSGWGTVPFTAREILAWAESGLTADARAFLSCARAICRRSHHADLTARGLGLLLARLVQAGAPLQRIGDVRGSALWQLRDVRE